MRRCVSVGVLPHQSYPRDEYLLSAKEICIFINHYSLPSQRYAIEISPRNIYPSRKDRARPSNFEYETKLNEKLPGFRFLFSPIESRGTENRSIGEKSIVEIIFELFSRGTGGIELNSIGTSRDLFFPFFFGCRAHAPLRKLIDSRISRTFSRPYPFALLSFSISHDLAIGRARAHEHAPRNSTPSC